MSITDKLREYANKAIHRKDYMLGLSHDLMRIADRIDEAHKDELLSYRNAGYNDGYDAGFASADDWMEQHEDDMIEHGWVRLPVDADGVTWRGKERVFEDVDGRHYAMYGLMHDGERWYVDCGLVGPDKHHHLIETTLVRHAEPDTWERIIGDALNQGDAQDPAALVARCKALAGEE